MNACAPADLHVCIMAGGKGERFWPLSRASKPKQLLNIVGDRSMIAETALGNELVVPAERLFIVTIAAQADDVARAVPALPRANIIAEPCGRNTAPCIGLMCALLAARDENSVLAVVPADHHIPNKDVYAQTIRDAAVVAAREKALVTIGIAPTFPETGFGYVLAGAPLDTATPTQFSRVDRFVEKPSRARAEELLATSRALWNAGMFVFRVVDMLAAFAAHMPDLHTGLERIRTAAAAGAADIDRIIAEVYAAAPSISIDYGVMEKAANVIVAHGRFIWDDVGSWRAVAAHWPRDAAGNANCGTVVTVDTAGSVLRNEGHGVVAVIGMRDIIVVRTDDAVLVCPLDRAQDVKQIVQTLQADASLRALTE